MFCNGARIAKRYRVFLAVVAGCTRQRDSKKRESLSYRSSGVSAVPEKKNGLEGEEAEEGPEFRPWNGCGPVFESRRCDKEFSVY